MRLVRRDGDPVSDCSITRPAPGRALHFSPSSEARQPRKSVTKHESQRPRTGASPCKLPPKSVYPHLGLRTHLLGLARTLGDPGLCLVPSLVEGEKAGLAAPLDELIWLCDELGGENPARELSVGGDGAGGGIPGDLGYLRGGVDEGGDDLCGGDDWGCTFEPVGKEQLGIVLADRCRSCSSRVPRLRGRKSEHAPLEDMVGVY